MENVQLWETPWRAWDLSEVLEDGGISRSREEMKTQAEESKAVIMKKHPAKEILPGVITL